MRLLFCPKPQNRISPIPWLHLVSSGTPSPLSVPSSPLHLMSCSRPAHGTILLESRPRPLVSQSGLSQDERGKRSASDLKPRETSPFPARTRPISFMRRPHTQAIFPPLHTRARTTGSSRGRRDDMLRDMRRPRRAMPFVFSNTAVARHPRSGNPNPMTAAHPLGVVEYIEGGMASLV